MFHQHRKSLDARFETEDFLDWEKQHGRIPEGAVVLVHTGHGSKYHNRTAYLGYPPLLEGQTRDEGDVWNLHFPGFHPQAAEWLVEEREIVGVGLDTPSMDYGQSSDFETHQIFGEANIWGLENVANLDQLPPKGFRVFAMVQKLEGGSGGPARVLAVPEVSMETTSSSSRISFKMWLLFVILLMS